MNTEIVDVLIPRVEALPLASGDVLAISMGRPIADDAMTELARELRRLLLERGKNVLVAVLPPGITIKKLDEDDMRALGWARVTQTNHES